MSTYLIYPRKEASEPMCKLLAEGKRQAMKKARAMFKVGKGAFARPAN